MVDHRQVIDKFDRGMFVQHDARAAAQAYAEDAVLIVPDAGELKGRKAIEEYLAGFLRAVPNPSHEAKNFFSSGEWCAYEFVIRGVNSGPLELGPGQTVPATGRPVELKVCAVMRVTQDGLVSEDHSYFDVAALMEQLGVSG